MSWIGGWSGGWRGAWRGAVAVGAGQFVYLYANDLAQSSEQASPRVLVAAYAKETAISGESNATFVGVGLGAAALAQATELAHLVNTLVISSVGVAEASEGGGLRIALFTSGSDLAQSDESGFLKIGEIEAWWTLQYAPLIFEIANQAASMSLFDPSSAIEILRNQDDLDQLLVADLETDVELVYPSIDLTCPREVMLFDVATPSVTVNVLPRS